MDILSGLPERARKNFIDAVSRADREYKKKIDAVEWHAPYQDGNPLERGRAIRPVAQRATLEYLGSLLFFLVDSWSSLDFTDENFRERTNMALTVLRHITLESKWPKPIDFGPGFELQQEWEFDRMLISWLESQVRWRKYDARLAPQTAVATETSDSGQDASSPLVYFPVWELEGLTADARRRIRAGLLEIHGAFLDDKTKGEADCWRRAYDLVADEFDRAGKLSDDLVSRRIPEIVADAAVGGGWSFEPAGRVQPTSVFNVRVGTRFYTSWRAKALRDGLKGRMTHWSGRLILNPSASTLNDADGSGRGRKAKSEDHEQVAAMVGSLEGDWKSEANLRRLAEWMDSGHLEVDQRWRTDRIYTWVDKLELDPVNFVKAIEYRLSRAKRTKK